MIKYCFYIFIIILSFSSNAKAMSRHEVMNKLLELPEIQAIYSQGAGVFVKEHTLEVMRLFEEQYMLHKISNIGSYQAINILPLFRFILALHDVGKPHAIGLGNRDAQHEFTIPILQKSLSKLGFGEIEVRIAEAIVGHDILGNYIQDKLSEEEAFKRIVELSKSTVLTPGEFFKLLSFYYMVDVASYPYLRGFLIDGGHEVNEPKSRMMITNSRYDSLARRFHSSAFNKPTFNEVEMRIDNALSRKKRPVVFLDLDDTVFIHSARNKYVLHLLDHRYGTNYFDNVPFETVPSNNINDFLSLHLEPKVAEQWTDEFAKQRVIAETYLQDAFNFELIEIIRRWKSLGATLVYVTGRGTKAEDISLYRLIKAGVAIDGLYHYEYGVRTDSLPEYKVKMIEHFLSENPDSEAVAFYDDNHENVVMVSKKIPSILVQKITLHIDPETKNAQMYLISTSKCEDLLGKK